MNKLIGSAVCVAMLLLLGAEGIAGPVAAARIDAGEATLAFASRIDLQDLGSHSPTAALKTPPSSPAFTNSARAEAVSLAGDAETVDPVVVGAGDIADCGGTDDEATANLLDGIPGTVITLGDNAYPDGTTANFTNCYEPSWGRHKARTRPAVGNHEYHVSGAADYFTYFGALAGDPTKGYYSYVLDTWLIIVLNYNCSATGGCSVGSPQNTWLRAQLAANLDKNVLAYWHYPLFSSGYHGNNSSMRPFWDALYEYGAEVVLVGHDHMYERFAPQTSTGVADPAYGIREFVVGTGGASLYDFNTPQPNSEVRNNTAHGVIKLTLHPTSYDWQFVPQAGQSFTDAGTGPTHGPPSSITTTPAPATPTLSRTPTNTRTNTPTATPTRTPTRTPTIGVGATNTVGIPTATHTPAPGVTPPTATRTSAPGVTPPTATDTPLPVAATQTPDPEPTTCTITFTDVPPGSTYYPYVQCLACRGIVSGYSNGKFRPENNVTRGQAAKIVSSSAGFSDPPPPTQTYEDVPPDHTFYIYVERLSSRGLVSGYPCGGPREACGPQNRPYFRPSADASRGQISKLVSSAAGYNEPPVGQTFEDVPGEYTFYPYIERLASRGTVSGYPCGGPREPCGPQNRPYFRPGNAVTRGQISKMAASTFFPECVP